jgi:copper chaperone NosL
VRPRALLALAALLGLALAACSEPTSGPVRVVFGRETCDHCGMAISEPRFAAQLRTGPREVARFDDFGCAVRWLDEHGGAGAATEFWVRDSEGRSWIDARSARFRGGQRTPMAYGIAAAPAGEPGTLDFESAVRALREQEGERAARHHP